jgi:hypothetical protein
MGWFGWRDSATRGVLVAGRSYDFSDFTCAQVVALCEEIDALGARASVPLVGVPVDADFASAGDEDELICSAFVGILVAEGGTFEPLAVTREAMLQGLAQAAAIPEAVWAEVTAAYRAAGGKIPSEDELAVRLGCTGGLPMAKLAFGLLGPEDAGLGGTFVHGQAPDQSPHEIGVHGLPIAHCSYDGSPAEPFDLGDEAHAARVRQIPGGAYHLMAHFD